MYLLFRSAISGHNINHPIKFMGRVARIILTLHRSFHFLKYSSIGRNRAQNT